MAATHFVTVPTFHRKRIFQNQLFGELFSELLMQYRQQHNILLHDYVVMPDHVHLLLTVGDGFEVSHLSSTLLRAFADELGREYGYRGEVWETNLRDRVLQTAEQCTACTRQIHSNPVRGGFCDEPAAYPMSSRASRWVLDPLPESLRTLQSV